MMAGFKADHNRDVDDLKKYMAAFFSSLFKILTFFSKCRDKKLTYRLCHLETTQHNFMHHF
jgi:hypothetical protein